MAQTIIVTFENGSATVETKGFRGKACKDATAALEKALGKTTRDTATAEMSLPPLASKLKAGA